MAVASKAPVPQLQALLERVMSDEELRARLGEHLGKADVDHYLNECAKRGSCAFCDDAGFIQVDGCEIMICFHCFKIILAHVDEFKTFIGCR